MMRKKIFYFSLLYFIFILNIAFATKLNHTGLPLPRFANLKSNEVNLRSGPGKNYPILWIYKRQYYPVLITAEYDHWRRIEDHEGKKGWIHKALLASKNKIMTFHPSHNHKRQNDLISIYKTPQSNAPIIAKSEPFAIGEIKKCNRLWCQIHFKNITGWVKKTYLWGID